jgi:predicted CopG family antitoxin
METKTIALDREAYEALRRQKRKGESFSDVVKRLAGRTRPLTELAGLWKEMPSEDLHKIREFLRRGRELDRERLERLVKRWG